MGNKCRIVVIGGCGVIKAIAHLDIYQKSQNEYLETSTEQYDQFELAGLNLTEDLKEKLRELSINAEDIIPWIKPEPKSIMSELEELSKKLTNGFEEKFKPEPHIKKSRDWKKNRFYD